MSGLSLSDYQFAAVVLSVVAICIVLVMLGEVVTLLVDQLVEWLAKRRFRRILRGRALPPPSPACERRQRRSWPAAWRADRTRRHSLENQIR